MKKDENLPNKNMHSYNRSENHFQAIQIILEISQHITLVIEVDHLNKEIHEISHKTDIADRIVEITIDGQIQIQHNLFNQVPNQTQGIDTIPITDHETII